MKCPPFSSFCIQLFSAILFLGGGFLPLTAWASSTSSFFPSLDGDITSTDSVWATARAASSGTANAVSTDMYSDAELDGSYYIHRVGLYFDTSSLPDDAVIEQVILRLTPQSKMDNDGSGPSVVSFAPASPSSLADSDFDAFGFTPYASVNSSLLTANVAYEFDLDSSAFSDISLDGITTLGVLMGKDMQDSAPSGINYIDWYTVEASGVDTDPQLTVVYTSSSENGASSTATTTATFTYGEIVGDFFLFLIAIMLFVKFFFYDT